MLRAAPDQVPLTGIGRHESTRCRTVCDIRYEVFVGKLLPPSMPDQTRYYSGPSFLLLPSALRPLVCQLTVHPPMAGCLAISLIATPPSLLLEHLECLSPLVSTACFLSYTPSISNGAEMSCCRNPPNPVEYHSVVDLTAVEAYYYVVGRLIAVGVHSTRR
jgi:hypothetical protein